MKSAKEYRLEAKERLDGNWGWAILVIFVYGLIIDGISSITGGIGTLILGGAYMVGLSTVFLGLFRKRTIEFTDLFSAFNSNFTNTLVMGLLYSIFIFLWTLLFIIPGIIAAYSYSMAPYILADNPGMEGKEALDASKALMKGKKADLFILQLSFIGWVFVGILTLGIFFFWLIPWMKAADTAFYESIKHEVPSYNFYNSSTNTNNAESI